MKKLIFISIFLMITVNSFCQTSFYVEKTDDGFEQPIIDKLIELGLKVTTKQENSKYTIKCLISKTGMGRAKGSIIISETSSGDILVKSEEVNGQTSAFNGYASPKMRTMKKIADDYLEDLIKQLKQK